MTAKRRIFWLSILLAMLSLPLWADFMYLRRAPQDNQAAREEVRNRPEVKDLRDKYNQLLRNRIFSMTGEALDKVFPPGKRGWHAHQVPKDAALPLYVDEYGSVPGMYDDVNRSGCELFKLDDAGYFEFFYQAFGGLTVINYYPRLDNDFVPLKTTNDLPARIIWEKSKLEALEKWMDDHLPKQEDKHRPDPKRYYRNLSSLRDKN